MFNKKGVILIACIWMCVLILWLGMNSALLFRYKFANRASHILKVRSFYAALGGIMEALARMGSQPINIDADKNNQWLPDGKIHKIEYSRCSVFLTIEVEGDKININKVPPDELKKVFEKIGLADDTATILTDRIIDFIDPDDIPRSNGAEKDEYEQMGLNHIPFNSPFTEIEELLLVPGIDWNLFWKGEKPSNNSLLPDKNSIFESFSVYSEKTVLSESSEVTEKDNSNQIRNWKNGELYRIVSAASCGDYGKVVIYCIVKLQSGQIPHYKIEKIKEII